MYPEISYAALSDWLVGWLKLRSFGSHAWLPKTLSIHVRCNHSHELRFEHFIIAWARQRQGSIDGRFAFWQPLAGRKTLRHILPHFVEAFLNHCHPYQRVVVNCDGKPRMGGPGIAALGTESQIDWCWGLHPKSHGDLGGGWSVTGFCCVLIKFLDKSGWPGNFERYSAWRFQGWEKLLISFRCF